MQLKCCELHESYSIDPVTRLRLNFMKCWGFMKALCVLNASKHMGTGTKRAGGAIVQGHLWWPGLPWFCRPCCTCPRTYPRTSPCSQLYLSLVQNYSLKESAAIVCLVCAPIIFLRYSMKIYTCTGERWQLQTNNPCLSTPLFLKWQVHLNRSSSPPSLGRCFGTEETPLIVLRSTVYDNIVIRFLWNMIQLHFPF
jgi:hypothetical protein